jgi:heme/copper-type cytochrome/quinol oxidase subunit 2
MASAYNIYINFIIFIKLLVICLAITHLYLYLKHRKNSDSDKQIIYYKERAEIIFITLTAGLLIFLFNPRLDDRSKFLTKETKLVLYLLGVILLINTKWGVIFEESKYFKRLQAIV